MPQPPLNIHQIQRDTGTILPAVIPDLAGTCIWFYTDSTSLHCIRLCPESGTIHSLYHEHERWNYAVHFQEFPATFANDVSISYASNNSCDTFNADIGLSVKKAIF